MAHLYNVGQIVRFKGYAEPLPEGQAPLFAPGEEVRIAEQGEDSNKTPSYTVASVKNPNNRDTLFDDEIDPVPVAAEAAKAKPARAKNTAPAAVAAPAAPAAPAVTPKKVKAAEAVAAAPTLKGAAKPAKPPKTANLAAASAKTAAKPAKPAKAAKPAKPAKAPKVAVPQVKAEPEPIEIINTEAVEALMAGEDPTAALEAAQSLINQSEETYFTLGGVLAHIYHGKLYETLGAEYADKQGWSKYVEERLGVGYRKAMNLIDIYQTFTGLNVDEHRLSELGWTKVRMVVRAMKAENVEELLTYVGTHTKTEIDDYMKTTYPVVSSGQGAGQPTERSKRIGFKFSLYEEQATIVAEALDVSKRKNETTDMAAAMFAIISEWAQLSGAVETTLEEDLARVNARHGTTYGEDEVEESAGEQAA